MPTSFWTDPAKVERLVELWRSGLPVLRIAADLGTTKDAVLHKVRRLKLPARGSPIKLSSLRNRVLPEAVPFATSQATTAPAGASPHVVGGVGLGMTGNTARAPAATRWTLGCRWPLWKHHERPNHRYCGKPVVAAWPGVYCERCRPRAFARLADQVSELATSQAEPGG